MIFKRFKNKHDSGFWYPKFLKLVNFWGLTKIKTWQYLGTATMKEFMVFNILPMSMAVVTMRFGISAPLSIMVWSVTVRVPVTITVTITVMGICFGIGVSLRIGSRFYFGFLVRFSASPFPAIVTTVAVTTITTVTSITTVITSVVSFSISWCISCCVSWGQSDSGKEKKTCNL